MFGNTKKTFHNWFTSHSKFCDDPKYKKNIRVYFNGDQKEIMQPLDGT